MVILKYSWKRKSKGIEWNVLLGPYEQNPRTFKIKTIWYWWNSLTVDAVSNSLSDDQLVAVYVRIWGIIYLIFAHKPCKITEIAVWRQSIRKFSENHRILHKRNALASLFHEMSTSTRKCFSNWGPHIFPVYIDLFVNLKTISSHLIIAWYILDSL